MKDMFVKSFKYIITIISILVISIYIWEYESTVDRESLVIENRNITIFTEATGGRFGVYIVPKQKYVLFLLNNYDYIEMIESDIKYIAISNDSMKIHIPSNKLFIHYNGKKYLLQENTITHLKNFSSFQDVTIYYGNDAMKKKFVEDTKGYRIKEHS